MTTLLPVPSKLKAAVSGPGQVFPPGGDWPAETGKSARKGSQRPPARGPGTEFGKMTAALKLTQCGGCAATLELMDRLGPDGCRQHFDRIVADLRVNKRVAGWWETRRAEMLAVISGMAFQFNPLDPLPGMLTEAINRAEKQP